VSNEQQDTTPSPASGSILGPAAAPLVINLVLFIAAVGLALTGMFLGGTAGLIMIGVGALLMVIGFVVLLIGNRRIKAAEQSIPPADQWWYNNKTGEIEQGPQSAGPDRDGPYASREEALRAPEIARERAARWAAEEEQ